ncbi:MAG: SemiSWEET family transporter [Candidatus Falkowbacteria bacterium]
MTIGPLEIMLIASTLLEFNPLLQAIKIIKLKRAKDVSLWTYVMILAIGAMWLLYGIKINSLPLIIGNAIKLFASLTVTVVYLKYREPKSEIRQRV